MNLRTITSAFLLTALALVPVACNDEPPPSARASVPATPAASATAKAQEQESLSTPVLAAANVPVPTKVPISSSDPVSPKAAIYTPAPTPILTGTPTATPSASLEYLTHVIPPCTPAPRSYVVPCVPTPDWAPTAHAGGGIIEPPLHVGRLLNSTSTTPVFATHVVLRGTYLPGTVRCSSGQPLRFAGYENPDGLGDHLLIYCFADVRVNAYLLGSGPSTLTVIVRTSLYALPGGGDEEYGLEQLESRRFAYERALSEGGRYGYEEPLLGYLPPGGATGWLRTEFWPDDLAVTGPPGGIGGREAVMFIRPSSNSSVEAWEVSHRWDVERRDDETVVAIHPYREWFNLETHGSLVEMELPALTEAITTAHQARVAANGGRIGADESLPMLETDANRLRQYFADPKVGAYAPGVPTPAPPPPLCGLAKRDQTELLRDCQALLAAKDTLRGTAALNWSADTAITSWDGVTVEGTPSRVTKILLTDKSLTGTVPAELAKLTGLQALHLD